MQTLNVKNARAAKSKKDDMLVASSRNFKSFDKDVLDKYGVSGNFAASCVNTIANLRGVHIHVHFAYVEEGKIRVELRSKKVPVNFIATKYGGGGHKLASGAQVSSWKDVDNMIMDINDLLREVYQNEEA